MHDCEFLEVSRYEPPQGSAPRVVVSVDVEDWEMPPVNDRVLHQTDRVLALLREHGVAATFFILGLVAERHPNLVKELHQQGHEIASHGYGHVSLLRLTPEELREDVRRSVGLLEDVIGERVLGYRAPAFSVTSRNLRSLEILAELGLRYDSSIYPIRHRRYGLPGFPRHVARVRLSSGLEIYELPIATLRLGGVNIPVAGGGYFRLLPCAFLKRAIHRASGETGVATTYFHPYEFDDRRLALESREGVIRGWRMPVEEFTQNLGRGKVPNTLAAVMRTADCCRCRDVLPI